MLLQSPLEKAPSTDSSTTTATTTITITTSTIITIIITLLSRPPVCLFKQNPVEYCDTPLCC